MLRFRILYELTENGELRKRLIAAAALAGVSDPDTWVYERRWQIAATPGWAETYKAALSDVEQTQEAEVDLVNPQRVEPTYAISDAEIQAAITALRQAENPPAPDTGEETAA